MAEIIINKSTGTHKVEHLKVSPKKKVIGHINGISFVDADTMHHVFYFPSLDASGYGNTFEEAQQMALDSANETLRYLMDADPGESQRLLKSLGWSQDKMFRKNFSHAHVDSDGVLQGFNVVENSVQKISMTAA
ncbi:hypothetical protein LL912_00615 [Niabella sp. CC-SYL272]|uniref:hypothetical protein n=1 Tax=Niabella agricola TaxID=2891571 RepID=UPI001F1EA5F9|nr:hypothetical protein [Niabella agricola]MCF3107269.1 hypothetical protein [Niabella agricola]